MRYLPFLHALTALGVIGVTARAQAETISPPSPPPASSVAPASASATPEPVTPAPTPSGPAEAAPTPPPYPTSPDSLVVPPGPPPPVHPAEPPPPLTVPVEPPPPVYVASGMQPHGMRRPPRYRYREGTPLPEGYHLETRANRALVFGGLATFGIPYLIGTFGTLSVLGDGNSGWLAIPVAGPWLTLAHRESSCGEIGEPSPGGFECFSNEAGNGLLIASGVLQALGTAMIVFGVANPREYAVADYAKWHITPVATPRGDYGLVVSGAL